MSSSPTISIVVVTYNHGEYISECLESILNQKLNSSFEIILGEDHSSDGTRAICEKYALKYPDIIKLFLRSRDDVIHINGKPTGRFNMIECLKAAKGEYIALLEGDDYWSDPLKLQKQYDLMESKPALAGCFHDTEILFNDDPNTLKPWRTYHKDQFYFSDTISKYALFHTSSFFFRANFLELPEWFTQVQSGDMALFSIIASKGELRRIPGVMSIYRKSGQGITTNIKQKVYHKQRILLMQCLRSTYGYNQSAPFKEVIAFHKSELKKLFWGGFKQKLKPL